MKPQENYKQGSEQGQLERKAEKLTLQGEVRGKYVAQNGNLCFVLNSIPHNNRTIVEAQTKQVDYDLAKELGGVQPNYLGRAKYLDQIVLTGERVSMQVAGHNKMGYPYLAGNIQKLQE